MLRSMLIAACMLLPLAVHSAEEKKPTAQQEKMSMCNKEAKEKNLAGDERKKFMSTCLSASASASQQEKMKTCNADASTKNLKGEERKKYMSSCLKA